MGTFERIKELSPWLIIFFGIMLIAFFTIGDQSVVTGITGSRMMEGNSIGTVDDEYIVRKDYDVQINNYIEYQKKQGTEEPNTEQISEQVWNNLVNAVILKNEYNKTGFIVSDDQVRDVLIEKVPQGMRTNFTDSTGRFDKPMYLKFITDPEGYMRSNPNFQNVPMQQQQEILDQWRGYIFHYEDSIRNNTPVFQYQNLVAAAGAFISPNFAKEQFIIERKSIDVSFKAFPTTAYNNANIEVSDAEISTYYNEHKEDYISEDEAVSIKYLAIPLHPLATDSLKINKRVEELTLAFQATDNKFETSETFDVKLSRYSGVNFDYIAPKDLNAQKLAILTNLEIADVVGPIKMRDTTFFFRLDDKTEGIDTVVKARHILIKWDKEDDKDSALAYAKGLIKKIKGGADFAALAREHSVDKGSGMQGGDLGWFGHGRMVPSFDEACFKYNNLVPKPIESQFGYHIIDVVEKNSEKIKFSEIKFYPRISTITKNYFLMQAKSVVEQLQNGERMDTIAKKNNYIPGTSPMLKRGQALTISQPELITSRFYTDTAFAANKGDIIFPRMFEKSVVIAQVAEKRNINDYMSLEEVAFQIKNTIIANKKFELAKADAEKFYAQVKSSSLFNNTDSTLAITILPGFRANSTIPGIGNDVLFTAKAFASELNKVAEPFKGASAYYVLQVGRINVPTEKQVDESWVGFAEQYNAKNTTNIFNSWFMALRKKAEINDNRYLYYEKY